MTSPAEQMQQAVAMMAMATTTAVRNAFDKTPADYGLEYEDVRFPATDGVEISAWFVPAKGSNALVLQSHPLTFNKGGYTPPEHMKQFADFDVELIPAIEHLHEAGYNVLTMDMRNHGNSAAYKDGMCGSGTFEWQDIAGMMEYVRGSEQLKGMTKGIVAYCCGAKSIFAAIQHRPDLFDDVKCMISVQALSVDVGLRKTASSQLGIQDTDQFVEQVRSYLAKERGIALANMSPRGYIDHVTMPVMYAQVHGDKMTDPSDTQEFYDRTKTEKELFWIEGDLHRFDGYSYFGKNPEKMLSWLRKYMA